MHCYKVLLIPHDSHKNTLNLEFFTELYWQYTILATTKVKYTVANKLCTKKDAKLGKITLHSGTCQKKATSISLEVPILLKISDFKLYVEKKCIDNITLLTSQFHSQSRCIVLMGICSFQMQLKQIRVCVFPTATNKWVRSNATFTKLLNWQITHDPDQLWIECNF